MIRILKNIGYSIAAILVFSVIIGVMLLIAAASAIILVFGAIVLVVSFIAWLIKCYFEPPKR